MQRERNVKRRIVETAIIWLLVATVCLVSNLVSVAACAAPVVQRERVPEVLRSNGEDQRLVETGKDAGSLKQQADEGSQRQCIATLPPAIEGSTYIRYLNHSVSQDPVFVKYLHAALRTVHLDSALLTEYAEWCGLKPLSILITKHDTVTLVKYSSCRLRRLYRKHYSDWTLALIEYATGPTGLTNYVSADRICSETVNYLYQIHSVFRADSKQNKGDI